MPRSIDSTTLTYLAGSGANVEWTILVDIAFANETIYAHLGGGTFVNPVNGHSYLGVGTFGQLAMVAETQDLQAQGVSMTLSGVPTQLLTDCTQYAYGMGKCNIWLACMLQGVCASGTTPALMWSGITDAPSIDISGETFSITLTAENRLSDLNRAKGGRYTDADQRSRYPNDQGLSYVQYLADMCVILQNKK